jgi:hypothetical protein
MSIATNSELIHYFFRIRMRNSPFGDPRFMFKLIALFLSATSALLTPQTKPEIVAEPIPLFTTNLKRDYLAPVSEYAAGHRGVDLEVELGSEIYSPVSGFVSFNDKLVDRQVLTITSNGGRKYSFEPVCSGVSVGQKVAAGVAIGSHCEPDSTYEYHCETCIHFSVRTEYGYLSPLYVLGKLKPSVLTA